MVRLLVFGVCVWWLCGPTASQEAWTRRDRSAKPSAAEFTGERDPLLYNMFEVLISSLDDKFKRVDTIERAIHMVMRHMEIMDSRLQESNNMTAKILSRVESLEERVVSGTASFGPRPAAAPAAVPARLEQQLESVQRRLERLQQTVDTLEVVPLPEVAPTATGRAVPSLARGPARSRGRTTQDVSHQLVKDAEKMVQTINEVRGKVVAMDTKLSFHMGQMSDNLSAVIKSMSDVSGVLLEPPRPSDPSVAGRSKLDLLVNKIEPLMEVSSKMDEVWNVVVGTKSSIDDLVPKSDELIHTTNRQERAINSIHSDLQERTKQIIDNLGMVEQRLNKRADQAPARARAVDGDAGRNEPVTPFGHGRTTENTKRYIRPVAFPTRPTTSTAPVTREKLDKEAPFDLLDQQFLEAFQNYTATQTDVSTTEAPVPGRTGGRGRPNGIVFPGRAPPDANNSTFLSSGEQDHINIGGYSCEEFHEKGLNKSGVYYLRIHGTSYWYLRVYCDMETDGGGWTVVQRRDYYGEEDQQSFNQPWEEYKQGFGNPTRAFWLGNENIFMLTNTEDYQLRIELEDFDGETRYAQYSNFKMHGEKDNYKLEIGGYEGNAGDSMNDPWYGSNLNPFSTYDRDNDRSSLNCASMLKGGWWWRSCGRGLNGIYLTDPNDVIARQGIVWYRWRGWDYSLKRSVMMIRPNRLAKNAGTGADAD